MKLVKKITALAVSSLMMFSIAGMNVFAASTTQDGLEVSLTTDKETYSKDEKITATLSVKNTNKAAVNDVTLENVIPKGYEISNDSSANKSVKTLEAGASEVLVTNLTTVKENQESSEESSKIEESSKNVEVNPTLDVPPTGDNDKALYIAIFVLVAAFAVTVVCVKNKKGKQLLSLFLCVALMGAVLPLSSSLVSAKTVSRQIAISEKVKVDGNALSLDSIVSYNLVTAETENLTINLDGTLYDDGSKTYYQPEEMPTLTGTLENVFNVKKANCTVKDVNGNVLVNKDFEPEKQWTVDDFALIVGENTVTVSVEYTDGTKDEKTVKINNINEKNMNPLNVDKNDDDKDGVLNFIEELYHTDPKNEDSDKDGLTDYYEMAILGTDPNKPDTDGNGVSDADEDADNDGLTNIDEIKKYNTDPTCIDSDGDTISDSDEINKYKTDPNEADTDKDGKDDNWEIENGYDPIVPNTDFPEEKEETGKTPNGVQVNSNGYAEVTVAEDNYFLNYNTPGYIGVEPVHVEIEDGKTATLTFDYDPSVLPDGEQPKLYRFNEDTQKLEEVPSTVTEDGKVQANVNSSGDYVLLDHRKVEDVWNNDIYTSKTTDSDGEINIVFVVDRSYSMNSNDPEELRKKAIKKFLERLRPGKDKAALIQFTAIAETVIPLTQITNDNKLFTEALDAMENSDGGGCAGSDQNAGTNGAAGLRYALNEIMETEAPNKYIVFLTDGEDDGSEGREFFNTYDDVISDAKGKSIKIYTVGLIGSGGVDIELLKRIATETDGKYYLATAGADIEVEINPEEGVFPLEDIYDEIAQEVDKESDYNKDGITDYITRLICDKKLTTSTGRSDFFKGKSYDEVQKSGPDLDGDGLKNGEELEIKADGDKLYIKFNSDPTEPDSDNDGLSDYVETRCGTDPLKKNAFVEKAEVDSFTNSENFYSNIYLNMYNNSSFERGSVLIGNAFFGSTLDQKNLYREALINFFKEIDASIVQNNMVSTYRSMSVEFMDATFEQITDIIREKLELGEIEEYNNCISDVSELINNITDIVGVPKTLVEKHEHIVSVIKDLYLLKETNQIAKYNSYMKEIKEYMDLVPSHVTDTTRAGWTDFLNSVSANINSCGQKIGKFDNRISVKLANFDRFSDTFKTVSDLAETVNKATMVINIGMTAWDSIMDYCDITSSGQTIRSNIYILDCISSSTDNIYLKSAADDLRVYFNDSYSEGYRELYLKAIIVNDAGTKIALDLLHNFALDSGNIPLMIIEGVRLFGNLVFGMDELAENASKTVALAATSTILSDNYLNHLNGGYAVMSEEKNYWIAFKNYSDKIHITLINIAEARKCAEKQLAAWQDDEDIKIGCKNNADQCTELVKKYLAIMLAFNCV